MLKKAWHILISAGCAFILAALIVGGGLANLGLVPEALVTRICVAAMIPGTPLCYWALFIYKSEVRTPAQIKADELAARRARSGYRPPDQYQ